MSMDFDVTDFWSKIAKFAKKAGKEVIEKVVILYYVWDDPATPTWAKGVIVGALIYFVSPLDAIPDVIPVVGYSDDLAVLVAAIAKVGMCIKSEHKSKAQAKLSEWFD